MTMRGMVLCALGGLSSFAQNPATNTREINVHSVEKEAALGKQLADEFREGATAITSPTVQQYIENLGKKLAAQMPKIPFTLSFSVIAEDPCPTIHEPAALPGGYVFVSAPLFVAAQDEAEFAGMLAHSMAHVVQRHGTQHAAGGELTQPPSIPLVFAGSIGCTSQPFPLAMLRIQRTYERDADLLAIQTMARAGFDPNALVRYTERVQPRESVTPVVFSPLPRRDDRMSTMSSAIAKLPTIDYAAPTPAEFEAAREAVRQFLPLSHPAPPSLKRKPPQ